MEAENIETLDPLAVGRLLAAAIRPESPDVVLTGLQSDDLGYGQTGVIMAQALGLPHATIVMQVEALDGALRVKRELENGWFQHVELPLPALLTIQSGIKKIRYATLMGIKKAKSKEIRRVPAESLGPAPESGIAVEKIYVPPRTKRTQIFEGSPREAASQLVGKAKIRGARFMSVLAILEQRAGEWSRASLETLAAAQQIAAELKTTASAAVPGRGAGAAAAELSSKRLAAAYAVEHPLLDEYTADGYAIALRQLIERTKPSLVLLPHTYQVRDYLPALAAALDRVAVVDAVAHRVENGRLFLVRQLFQGKLNADLAFTGETPWFASLQAGAWRADRVESGAAAVETFTPEITAAQIRTRPGELFRESQRTLDLSAAERIVSVGRGIRDPENLQLVRDLADALGAELAASRPICDAGWLPMERQVGSSGQTVAPKMYMAIGISGAIQHLVGMKGSNTIVAVNKDATPQFSKSPTTESWAISSRWSRN